MNTLGFIGMGQMAQALARGFLASGRIGRNEMAAYAPHQDKLRQNAERIGFRPVSSPEELVRISDTVVMACKPYQIRDVLMNIGPLLPGKALISIAAGWDFAAYEASLPEGVRLQFVMPNTPAMVGEGVFLFEETNSLRPDERKEIMELFGAAGGIVELPSRLMGIGGAVTGCGPAFVDLMIEAYGDAAVRYGLPRNTAYELVSRMILGSARLQLETRALPGVLKDQVTSPAGTTISGVAALEENGFRHACIASIDAIMKPSEKE